MIRNIIKQRDSYTITLPKQWVEKNILKNKDPIELKEDDFSGNLIINTLKPGDKKKELELDMQFYDEWDAVVSINQGHRLGYDTIICRNLNEEYHKSIEKFVKNRLIGFTYEKAKEKIIIDSLVQDVFDPEKIKSHLRKLFIIIEQTFLSKKEELNNLKDNADTTSYYLRRNIIKFNYKGKLAHQYVSLVNRLILIQHATHRHKKNDENKLLKEVHKLFMTLEKGFWTADLKLISEINNLYEEIESKIDEEIKKNHKPNTKYLYESARMIKLCVPVAAGIMMEKNDSL